MSYADDYIARLNSIKASRQTTGLPGRSASKSELANLILQRAHSDFSIGQTAPSSTKEKKDDRGIWGGIKSTGQGILDILSRPLYAVAEATDSGINETDGNVKEILKGLGQGFTGKEKTDFIDVLKTFEKQSYDDDVFSSDPAENEILKQQAKDRTDNSKVMSGAGLAMDLVLDPINLVPGAILAAPFKAGKNLIRTGDAVKASEEVLGLTGAAKVGEQALSGAPTGTPEGAATSLLASAQQDIPAAFAKTANDLTNPAQAKLPLATTPGQIPFDRAEILNLPEGVTSQVSEEVTRTIPGGELVTGSKQRKSLMDILAPVAKLSKNAAQQGALTNLTPEILSKAEEVAQARKLRMRQGMPPTMTPQESAFAKIWDDLAGATGRASSDLSRMAPNRLTDELIGAGDSGIRLSKKNAKGAIVAGPDVSLAKVHQYLTLGVHADELEDLYVTFNGQKTKLHDIKTSADAESQSGDYLLKIKSEKDKFKRADPKVDPTGRGYQNLIRGIAQYELTPTRYGIREIENPEFFNEFKSVEQALRKRKVPEEVLADVKDTWADLVAANGGKPLPQEQFTKMVEEVIDEYDPSILGDKSIAQILPKTVKETVTKTVTKAPEASEKEIKGLLAELRKTPKFAKLQEAKVIDEAKTIVDEVGQGNEAAIQAVTGDSIKPVIDPSEGAAATAAVGKITKAIDEANATKSADNLRPTHPAFNAPKQNNLSNSLAIAAGKEIQKANPKILKPHAETFIPQLYGSYSRMLRQAEDDMIRMGKDKYMPRLGNGADGLYIRLSDVLERLGPKLGRMAIFGPKGRVHVTKLLNAIGGDNAALEMVKSQNLDIYDEILMQDWSGLMSKEYALRTIEDTNKVKPVVDDAADAITAKATDPMLSESAKVDSIKVVEDIAKGAIKDSMPATKKSVADLLKSIADKSMPKLSIADEIISRRKNSLVEGITNAASKPAQAARIDTAKASADEIVPEAFKNAKKDPAVAAAIGEAGAMSTVLKWFKPNFGYAQLRPLLLKNVGARKASAAIRAHDIKQIFKLVPVARHSELWDTAVGKIPAADESIERVAMTIQKVMGNMFVESGLKDAAAGNTAMARAGVNLDDLNRHVRIAGLKDFKFAESHVDDATGATTILKDLDILDSWRFAKPANPQEFMFRLSQAAENAMVEYSTWADIGGIWGSKIPRNGTVEVSGMHPAIDGMHFEPEIAQEMSKVAHGIDEFYEPLTNNNFIKMYDQALRAWKSGVTIYAPSHHVRNMIGDMFMSWLDGVNNPKYYSRAGKIILSNRNRYSDVIGSDKLPMGQLLGAGREKEIMDEMMVGGRMPKGSDIMAHARIKGKTFKMSSDQVYQMGFRHGLFPHSNVIEDLPGTEGIFESLAAKNPKAKRLFQPLGGKGQKAAREVSESREHLARMAHYLHAIENTKADSLDDLFRKAAARVRKYHPDGLDLTPTEKNVMRRLLPFYSWTRKAIPLILEGVVTNPHKIMAYPKIQHGLAESQGITDTEISQPFPEDQLFPDWLSGNVIGPMFDPASEMAGFFARSEDERGYVIANPGNPATDIFEDFFNNPAKGVLGSVTPGIKLPMEMLSGTDLQTGAPIKDKTEYLDKNIPLLSTLSRITNGAVGTGLVEGGDLKGKETDATNQAALINFLTAAGILDTGRYIKGGEFDLREYLRKQAANAN